MELKTGNKVLLAIKYLNIARVRPSHKFGPLYIGPFKVLECYSTAYKLELPKHIQVYLLFYVSQLKLYQAPKDENHRSYAHKAVQMLDDHEEYFVKEIANH